MKIAVFQDKKSLAQSAATDAADALRKTIQKQGSARIIAATGAAQFDFLELLTQSAEIDWSKVEMFHLDEYIGLAADHPASFRKFLLERLINKTGITRYHLLDGDQDPQQVIRALTPKSGRLQLISHSSASGRTDTWHSMIRPRISPPKKLT